MDVGDLLTPWMMLAAVLMPLIFIESWIHSHLYGVGWLLTNDNKAATYLYYILLFPGVLMHELVQWLVSGAIRVETKRIRIWPEAQKDGTLRLDFVQIKDTNPIAASIIGAAPLVVGLALVWAISNYVLNLNELVEAIGSGELEAIAAAIRGLASTPDFYFWLWLLFAISNAMLPTPTDRQGWPLVIGMFVAVVVFLIVIGTGERLEQTYRDSVVVGLEHLSTAFSTVLVVEIPAVILIGFSEEILERSTGRKFFYRPPVVERKRQPGSPDPLEPGEPKPSVYLLELPIPMPPDKPKSRRPAARPAPGTAAGAGATPRTPSTPDTRPGFTPRESPTGTSPARASAADRPASSTASTQFSGTRSTPGPDRPGTPDRPSARPGSTQIGGTRPAVGERPQPGSPDRPSARPDRPSQRPGETPSGGARTTGERSAVPGRPQPGSPDHPSARPDRPALRPGETPSGGTRATGERPAMPGRPQPDRPAVPQGDRFRQSQQREDRFARPAQPRTPDSRPKPSDDEDNEEDDYLSGFRQQRRARPSGSTTQPERPPTTGQRSSPTARPAFQDRDRQTGSFSRPQRPAPGSPADRPPRGGSPFLADDDDEEDDLEYVPFDDVETPDDDDDFYGR